jgi:hypothetical protein
MLVSTAFAIAMLGTTLPTPLYPLYQKTLGFGELITTDIPGAWKSSRNGFGVV